MISNPFSAKPAGEAQPACPICGGTSFVDYRRRVKARCGKIVLLPVRCRIPGCMGCFGGSGSRYAHDPFHL